MIWSLSAFKPNVPVSIQAWLLLKHTGHILGASLSTDVPKCLIGYHWYLQLLVSHRLDPCEAFNLGIVCSRQLHGNMGPCDPLEKNSIVKIGWPLDYKIIAIFYCSSSLERLFCCLD